MTNERIDVKAEAAGITWMSREDAERGIIDLCARVRDEAKRETVDTISPMICLGCRSTSYYLGADGYHRHKDGEAPAFRCVTLDIRAAFAEPGKEQEPATQRDFAAMLDAELEAPEPGNCSESPNGSPVTGPTTEYQQAVADADHDTKHELRQFVDAAAWLANNVITTFTPDHGPPGCRMPGCVPCTILRLAPQFEEKP